MNNSTVHAPALEDGPAPGGGYAPINVPPEEEISLQVVYHRLIETEREQHAIQKATEDLRYRTTQLEISEKLTRWIIAGSAIVTGFLLREIISIVAKALTAG